MGWGVCVCFEGKEKERDRARAQRAIMNHVEEQGSIHESPRAILEVRIVQQVPDSSPGFFSASS